MRAKDFLLEYRRDVTAQKMGDRLIQAFSRIERGHNVPDSLYGAMTLAKMVYEPHLFVKGKTVSFDVMGSSVTVNPETVSEVLNTLKPKIADAILEQLEDGDPTPHKEYTQWIAARYITGDTPLEDIGSTLKEYLHKFVVLKRKKVLKPPANDINRYNSFGNFMDVMDEYELPEEEVTNKGNATEVYLDANVRVLVPEDKAAAIYYGRGTRWCTAATQGNNYFDHYNRQGPLYIILPKNPQYEGEKYQLHFPSSQFMNEQDHDVPLYDLLDRFNLIGFFKQQEEAIGELVEFADDAVLAPIINGIKEYGQEFLWDEISEWENQDDYWNTWRAEQAVERGLVDDNGDVDWDEVYNEPDLTDYTEWNDDVRQMYKEVMVALDYSPESVRSFIISARDGGDNASYRIDQMDAVMARIVRYETGNNSDYIADIIEKRIAVSMTQSGWKVSRVGR